MSFSSAHVINQSVTCRRADALVAHLPLNVQQVTAIPQAVNGVGISKLMRRDMGQADIQAAAGQRLANPRRSNGLPLTTNVADEQRLEAGRQGQPGAGLEPVFQILGGLFVEENNPIHMGLATGDKAQTPAFLDGNIVDAEAGKLANAKAGIQGQRPDRQGANIQPVTLTLIGFCLKIVKQLLQIGRIWRAGDQFWGWRALSQVNGVAVQPPAFVEPGKPRFKSTVVIIDRGIFQITGFAINQELINSRRGWRKVGAGMNAELVKYPPIAFNGFRRLARLGLQKIGNGSVNSIKAIRLNKDQVFAG